jgi:hypothetical protein
VKALSLRQPYAHSVVHYGKTLENRRWSTRFRGEFLIHAAKGMTGDEYTQAEDFIVRALQTGCCPSAALRGAFKADFEARGQRGGFIGIARLVDVIPPCTVDASPFHECPHRWHIPEQYAFVLEDVRPIPFTPYKGSLSFFNVPESVTETLRQFFSADRGAA